MPGRVIRVEDGKECAAVLEGGREVLDLDSFVVRRARRDQRLGPLHGNLFDVRLAAKSSSDSSSSSSSRSSRSSKKQEQQEQEEQQ
jgi:hypothetical protein